MLAPAEIVVSTPPHPARYCTGDWVDARVQSDSDHGMRPTGRGRMRLNNGKDSRPVIACGEGGDDDRVIGFWVDPLEPDQDDTALRGETKAKREFAEVGVSGDDDSLLALRHIQNGRVTRSWHRLPDGGEGGIRT